MTKTRPVLALIAVAIFAQAVHPAGAQDSADGLDGTRTGEPVDLSGELRRFDVTDEDGVIVLAPEATSPDPAPQRPLFTTDPVPVEPPSPAAPPPQPTIRANSAAEETDRFSSDRSRDRQDDRYETAYERYLRNREAGNARAAGVPPPADDAPTTRARPAGALDDDEAALADEDRLTTVTVAETVDPRAGDDIADTPPDEPGYEDDVERDPWAPVGFYTGSILWFPGIEVSTGYSSNAGRRAGGRGAALLRVAPDLTFQSDWVRHSLTGVLRGAYTAYFDSIEDDDIEAQANVDLGLDITDLTTGNINLRYSLDRESNASTIANTGALAVTRAYQHVLGGEAGIRHVYGALAFGLRGSVERQLYGDSALFTGGISGNDDRDQLEYRGTFRIEYENDGLLSPFAEAFATRRDLDRPIATGFNRNSTGYGLRGGIAFDAAPKLTGELALGYRVEDLKDPRLRDLDGFTFDAAILWSPTAITTIAFNAGTDFDTNTVAGSSGSIRRTIGVTLSHALRRNLLFTASGSVENEDVRQSPLDSTTYRAGAGLVWRLSRHLHANANYEFEKFETTAIAQDYTANVFTVGLRLQR